MNNDYKANHSSNNPNYPNAKRIPSNYNQRFFQPNTNTYYDQNSQNSPYVKSQIKRNIRYQNNQRPNPYEEEIVRGYYINSGDEHRFRNENGREEEIEIEENLDMENGEENINDGFIGDGEYVRNDMTNENNNYDYSPNLNGQNLYAYYNLRNINNNNLNNNKISNYNYEPKEDPEEIEEKENNEYLMESPQKDQNNNFSNTQYNNFNNKVYQKRRVLGNLKDSASSEAYATKSISRATLTDYRNSGIYIKPKTSYNNNINKNNGISTEERGIESLKESTKKVSYGNNYEILEESPIYNYPENQSKDKGGKVDFNLSLSKLKNNIKNKRQKEEEKYDIDWYKNNLDKIIKIQATFRYYRISKIMKQYHDCDEFIFHISKVQFNHFYDNFYFFINQLFNVYKANIGALDLVNNNQEQEENENEEEENNEESDNEENKSYDQLLNDYTNLKKKYNALMKSKNDNNTNTNHNNNNSKSSFKKINPELASLPGETTFGSIKTDTHKFRKFKASLQKNNNNSTSNIKLNDNLTISNYNDDDKYERHFYTPDHYDDEDSFNDAKDKRYSYSSVHSDEYSKYFDNEQPKHRFMSFNNKKLKGIGLSRGTRKNKIFEYSPSIEIEKQSRDNSTKRNNINDIQNEKISNISVININRSGLEEPDDNFNKKRIEEIAYDKYINNYGKNLTIVKNNKILLKSKEEDKNLEAKNFDNKLIFKENENIIHIKPKKKTDEQKIKEIVDNKRLYEKLKSKLEKEKEKYRHNNITNEEQNIIPNKKDNRYKLLKKSKRTKDNYFTINQEQKKETLNILKKANENNFEIKSEYYYIETKDSILPEIIEKKIKESNIQNQPIINKENEFKEEKTILSSGDNFNIKGKKPEHFQDIESNELIIINKQKNIKKKNEIKKNENIAIYGQLKKWNLIKDLNHYFSLNNDTKKPLFDTEKNKEKLLYIETNELQVIDNFRKNKKREKEYKKIINRFDNITQIKNEELIINKGEIQKQKKEKEQQLFKCNENNIKIKPIKKPKVREIKITTKKILKQEKILSRKKFLKNQYTSENSFTIKGKNSSKIELGIKKGEEFLIKRKKKKMKEQEIQTAGLDKKNKFENVRIEELDEINIESKNVSFLKRYLDLYKKEKKIKNYSVFTSNQIQLNSENKKENKFKNLNIGKNIENEIIIKNEEGVKKKEKEYKFEIRQNLIEQFTFKGNKKRLFTNLDIKKCEGQNIKAIKKEKIKLEKIPNGELIIKHMEKDKKEIEVQTELDLINNNLDFNSDIKYKIYPIKKPENIIVKNKSFNIRHKRNNSNLIIVKQKKLDLIQKTPKKFRKETIEPCYSEALTIKTREDYEDPLPNFRLSKKFTKFLISDNDNLQPENNINLIKPLSETNETQFEIIGNKKEIIEEKIEEIKENIQKPLIENEMDNKDFEKNMTKQFINNMVQNKLEIEKKKTMDNTKNKLITIFKAMKMKNALMKNNKNKKYFLNALKNIKDSKLKSLIKSNTFSHNYLPKDKNTIEEFTETNDLKSNPPSKLFIENNIIQIKNKKGGKFKKLYSEIRENDINIEAIKNKIEKVDKEVQMSPKKEFKITMKRTFKKEKVLKRSFTNMQDIQLDSFSFESDINPNQKTYIDASIQTPKLRPKKKSPNKVIFNEIKTVLKNEKSSQDYKINHTFDMSYIGKINDMENSNSSIKIEKEDIKDRDKIYRISQFNKFFKHYFDTNKKIAFLKLLYLTKWIHLSKNNEFDKSKSKSKIKHLDIKYLFDKYKSIFVNNISDFAKKYKTEKANNLMINLFNRRKEEAFKKIKINKRGNKLDANILRKNKIALIKLSRILRNNCGKYIISLYKKSK